MQFREHQLDNGLQVIAECNPRACCSAAGFFVRAGARDESDSLSGVSHFLEHMVFKGTERREAADVNRELDDMGAQSNAFTSEEQTVYYAAMLPEYLPRGIDLLADIMRPSLRERDFVMEKQVILEEIAKYDDQPPYGAQEKVMALHFDTHPLARSVLGTCQSVEALSRDQMAGYWQQRYSPSNMTLAAAGKIDFDALVRQLETLCGSWERADVERAMPAAGEGGGMELIHKAGVTQQYVLQLANGPAADDPQRFAGRVMATVFGDESGSRLFWELVDSGKAEIAAFDAHEFEGTGIFMNYLCCAPDRARQNAETIDAMLATLRQEGISKEELEQAQNKICSHVVLGSERTMNRLFAVGMNWMQRQTYRTVAETVDDYSRVSCQDVAALLERFPLDRRSLVTVGPLSAWDE
jgi:predicted Zn-dependent peptidase